MRRLLLGFVLLLMACQVFTPGIPGAAPLPSLAETRQPGILLPTAPATAAPTSAAAEAQPAQDLFAVHFHPDGPLYVGDQVSLEVVAPPHFNSAGKKVSVSLEQPGGSTRLGEAGFGYYGIGGRLQATLQWVWDTSALSPGAYTLSFTLEPDGLQWSQPVVLHPSSQAPSAEQGAHWAVASTDCCQLHYITGTRAERDLPLLQEIVDEQASELSQRLGVQIDKPIDITFVPRVVGQGGFTSQEIAVSYPERNYIASDIGIVVKHELVHALDARLGGELRPSLLAEGLAVYLVGGHFKLGAAAPPRGCAAAAAARMHADHSDDRSTPRPGASLLPGRVPTPVRPGRPVLYHPARDRLPGSRGAGRLHGAHLRAGRLFLHSIEISIPIPPAARRVRSRWPCRSILA